ncbi:fatty acyl-AMP ligase [Streptomyces murinus]|uniref:fatty acyl-AMP ligase n=1 Tax=Streptomyces murinus TaxID=33900 RepID=UPI0018F2842F|nr:fatty acyl-AMP ligase [Streptomyces murinus]
MSPLPPSAHTSLVHVLEHRATQTPDRLAFRFLPDGTGDHPIDWTYGELAERAGAVAAHLGERGLTQGHVVLALDPGLDYVAGLLGIMQAGCTAVPCFPPFGRRATARFLSVLDDCNPRAVLTDPRFAPQVDHFHQQLTPTTEHPQWIFPEPDFYQPPDSGEVPMRVVEPALIQYSSGSTGDPKGIVLTHENLLSNCRVLDTHMGYEEDRVGCSWLPPYHDMGLMGTIMLALHGGWPLVMLSPIHFVQDPYRWLKAITDHKVTISVGPNFAFDLCTQNITDEELTTLDLSRLRQVFCGSEPVSGNTMERFEERFAPVGFDPGSLIPCYGLAEATLFVSGKPEAADTIRTEQLDKTALEQGHAHRTHTHGDGDGDGAVDAGTVRVVSCGIVADGHEVLIVDPDTLTPLTGGESGEIWVNGANVAAGYLGRPELTAQTFGARPAHAADDDHRTYLRTGDLGFLLDGELFVTGRLKDLIVISGRNLHPQDIEHSVLRAHQDLRRIAAFALPSDKRDEEEVVLVAEFRGTAKEFAAQQKELLERVTAAVTEDHGVRPGRVHIGPPGCVLMTTSGKVRRRDTRKAYLDGTLKTFPTPTPATSTNTPADAPASGPAGASTGVSAGGSADTQAGTPADASASVSAGVPVSASADASAGGPAGVPVSASAGESTGGSAETPAGASAGASAGVS